jgi:hypothetical protein
MYAAWGGDEMLNWAKRTLEEMEENKTSAISSQLLRLMRKSSSHSERVRWRRLAIKKKSVQNLTN